MVLVVMAFMVGTSFSLSGVRTHLDPSEYIILSLSVSVRIKEPGSLNEPALLKSAEPLSLADLSLDIAGEAFEFSFDSQHCVRTDLAGELLDRTLDYAKHPFCLISCTDLHDEPPCS